MDVRPLAAATFEDQDAGSGPIHSSPNLGPMTGAIHNISARHLHDIGATVPDDRQFLRSWRRQLQECMASQNSRAARFLLADASGSTLSESELARRCNDILTKYARPTWNFASSTRDLSLPTSTADAGAAIEEELGIAPAALREQMRRTIRLYVNAAAALCAAETRLEDKLKRLESVVGRVNDLMFMEPTPALEGLGAPMRAYLDSVLEKISIEEDYQELIEQYKKFAILKGVVSLGSFQKSAAPTCSICMVKEVNQAVTPCGHTFCDDCCRTQMTACYICRVQIRDKIRLFFA